MLFFVDIAWVATVNVFSKSIFLFLLQFTKSFAQYQQSSAESDGFDDDKTEMKMKYVEKILQYPMKWRSEGGLRKFLNAEVTTN